ncbi:MAG: hypothetical protein V3S11_05365 [Elusimicrobiota bacterium]
MPLAATARITFDPEGILHSRWIHDMAHRLSAARFRQLKIDGAFPHTPK